MSPSHRALGILALLFLLVSCGDSTGPQALRNDTIRLSLGGEGPGAPDAFPAVFVKE